MPRTCPRTRAGQRHRDNMMLQKVLASIEEDPEIALAGNPRARDLAVITGLLRRLSCKSDHSFTELLEALTEETSHEEER